MHQATTSLATMSLHAEKDVPRGSLDYTLHVSCQKGFPQFCTGFRCGKHRAFLVSALASGDQLYSPEAVPSYIIWCSCESIHTCATSIMASIMATQTTLIVYVLLTAPVHPEPEVHTLAAAVHWDLEASQIQVMWSEGSSTKLAIVWP